MHSGEDKGLCEDRDSQPYPSGVYFYVLLFKHDKGLFGDLELFFIFFFKANKLISCRGLVLL